MGLLHGSAVSASDQHLEEIKDRNRASNAYFAWLRSIPKEWLKDNYEVLVYPEELTFSFLNDEKEITITVINKRNFTQYFNTMNCAWFFNFSIDSEDIDIVRWACRANVGTLKTLEPNETWIKRIKVTNKWSSGKGSFKIYFYPFDQLVTTVWKNKMKKDIDYFIPSNSIQFNVTEPVGGADSTR